MKLFLVGFMGCGKSTVGRKVAAAWRCKFVDLDQRVCDLAGATVEEIFATQGEEAFRRLERQALESLSESDEDMVVATGGGAPCYGDNMELILRLGKAVYLRMSPQALQQRLLHARAVRPKILGMGPEELLVYVESLLKEREAYYLRASVQIACDEVTPHDVVRRIRYLCKR